LKVTFAPKGTLKAFDTPICDAWVIRDVITFDQFIAIYDEKAAKAVAGFHLFSSFDWYDQACYTSGHARSKYDLDPIEEIADLDDQFAATHQLFMAETGTKSFSGLAKRLSWAQGDGENPSFENLNTPPSQCMDVYMVMQIVPVAAPEDALSAFPNGYFADDLTPFEVHAIAAHFRAQHGYRLIAIGASYMCFLRDVGLVQHEALAVATDIMALHKAPTNGQSVTSVATTLTGKRHLILSYVNH
jgi:hypothetical protein